MFNNQYYYYDCYFLNFNLLTIFIVKFNDQYLLEIINSTKGFSKEFDYFLFYQH